MLLFIISPRAVPVNFLDFYYWGAKELGARVGVWIYKSEENPRPKPCPSAGTGLQVSVIVTVH